MSGSRAWILIAGLVIAAPAGAQQLSLRSYTVAHGLAHDDITSILQDSRGYLWIGTFEGVSRFDGYAFHSYDTADGLGNYVVNALAEDRQQRLWVATNGGGIAVLNDAPEASPRFSSFLPDRGGAAYVNVLAVGDDGRLWCGTDGGIYVADVSGEAPIFTYVGFGAYSAVAAAVSGGSVWIGVNGVGLLEFGRGRTVTYEVPWPAGTRFRTIAADGGSGLLVAGDPGLFKFSSGRWERLPVGLRPGQVILGIRPDDGEGAWLATNEGLVHFTRGMSRRYPLERALGGTVTAIGADRSGTFWLGTSRAGLVRVAAQQILRFTAADGLPDADVSALMETPAGDMMAVMRRGATALVRGDRIVPMRVTPLRSGHRPLVTASGGGWWATGVDGFYHIPGAVPDFSRARRLPIAARPAASLFSSVPLLAIDRDGALWGATIEPALYRVEDPSRPGSRMDRWPLSARMAVLGADDAGGIWLAHMAGLARFAGGVVSPVAIPPGLPDLQPRAFLVDRQHRVWIGLRFGGVMVTNDPATAPPVFTRYSLREGLASDTVWALAQGPDDTIYLGTGRGLDLFDPATGAIRHFTTDEGLAGNVVSEIEVDSSGQVWVAGMGGISRLHMDFTPSKPAPMPIYISRLQLAGVEYPLGVRGVTAVTGLDLRAGGRNVRIEFVSPNFQAAGRLRYQYMLDGTDATWTPPAAERVVNYATLTPGHYRFLVRAVAGDGRVSQTPGLVEFRIHPPFWYKPWFFASVLAGFFVLGTVVLRAREFRRHELESIRRQVATDLHDDVGSGLAQIAILCELAKRDASRGAVPVLTETADLARSLRESMGDIVWALSPDRDAPLALVARMRQVSFNLLSSTTEVTFEAPEDRQLAGLDLGPARRRQLLLIFKEALTNVARHASATVVSIRLVAEGEWLVLTIDDDGVGFDDDGRAGGQGLESMEQRARSMGGHFSLRSEAGKGTSMAVRVPLRRRTRMFRWLPRRAPRG